jgi:hypothetical protein
MQVEQYEITLGEGVGKRVMAVRLAAGLLQGLLLYWLYHASKISAWPATAPFLMVPLTMLGLILPVVLISSLGHLAPRKAGVWLMVALAVLLAISLNDAWRGQTARPFLSNWDGKAVYSPSELLVQFGVVFFFIAQTLVMAGTRDQRRIATYGTYFETAWKLAIQLMFSALFVGALFLVLFVGAELFMLVKLSFLRDLMRESWFNVPVICAAFSCAMHITDVRPAIVRGIRTLLLVLMSWILPVAVVIMTGFLCSLPFTGLTALWETRHATSVLLIAAALLVALINAAYQNGDASVALPLRVSARTAAILILPIVAVGIYALGLRVGQYGWTSDRVIAAACLLVASCYAIGYAWAASQYDTWLHAISTVNVAAAFLVLAVLLALFTPIADPARISVSNQMARLEKGKVKAADFDFRYLRFEGGRYGRAALEELAQRGSGTDAEVLRREAVAALALEEKHRWQPGKHFAAPISVADNLIAWPAGAQLPASFLQQKWGVQPDFTTAGCLTRAGMKCDAFSLDMNGDGKKEILLVDMPDADYGRLYAEGADGNWTMSATLAHGLTHCKPLMEKLRKGDFTLVEPRMKDLGVNGLQFSFSPVPAPLMEDGCERIK